MLYSILGTNVYLVTLISFHISLYWGTKTIEELSEVLTHSIEQIDIKNNQLMQTSNILTSRTTRLRQDLI